MFFTNKKYIAIDFGIDSMKSLLFDRVPLKYAEKYFPTQSLYSNGFKKDLAKIVMTETLKEFNTKIKKAYVCLPAEFIKEEVRNIVIKKKRLNKKELYKELTQELKNEIKGKIFELRILDFDVDGYKIKELNDFSQKEVSANIYCIYCDRQYYDLAESFFTDYDFETEFIYKGETILNYAKGNCLVIDSCYDITRIYEIENDVLKDIKEIKIGEAKILRDIMESFSLSKEQARLFKNKIDNLDKFPQIKEETERILDSYKKYFLLETKNVLNKELTGDFLVMGENAKFLKYIIQNEKEFEVDNINYTNALLIYAQKKNI